jgi:hypothetical protein
MVTHQGPREEAVSKLTHGNGEIIYNLKRIRVGVQSRTTNSVQVIELCLGREGAAGKSRKDKSNRFRSRGGAAGKSSQTSGSTVKQ